MEQFQQVWNAVVQGGPAFINFVMWAFAHWEHLSALGMLLMAVIAFFHKREWNKALLLAGSIAYEVAMVADLDKEAKRKEVKVRLKAALPAWARPLFDDKMLDAAVEYGWRYIAKQKLEAEKPLGG